MAEWGLAYGLCAVIYGLLTFIELMSGRYTHCAGYLLKCPAFYIYILLSLCISALSLWLFGVLFLDRLVAANHDASAPLSTFLNLLKTKPVFQGLFVGLTARGVLNISFVTLPIGTGVPLGPRLLLQSAESMLLKRLFVEHFNRVSEKAVALVAGKTSSLAKFKTALANAVPADGLDEKANIKASLNGAGDTQALVVQAIQVMGTVWTSNALKQVS